MACTGESHTGNAPAIVLDQHAEETLHAAQQRAMHHVRLMRLAIFADVLQPEAHRQVEVELNRAQLPFAAQRVVHFQIDLRAIERAAAFIGFVGNGLRFDGAAQRFRRLVPIGRLAHVLLGHRREIRP